MSSLYEQWADELLQHLANEFEDPFNENSINEAVKSLAAKLKVDLEKCIVGEWFCSDCDYKRRCEK